MVTYTALREKSIILFPQYNILIPQLIILFPQERYCVPTTYYYLVPSIYYFVHTTYNIVPSIYYFVPTTYYLVPSIYYFVPDPKWPPAGNIWPYGRYIQKYSPQKLLGQLEPNLVTIFLGWSPFKIASGRSRSKPTWPPGGTSIDIEPSGETHSQIFFSETT